MYCTSCGEKLPDGYEFCTRCGSRQAGAGMPPRSVSSTVPRQVPYGQVGAARQASSYIPATQAAARRLEPPRNRTGLIVGIAAVVIVAVAAVLLVRAFLGGEPAESPSSSAVAGATALSQQAQGGAGSASSAQAGSAQAQTAPSSAASGATASASSASASSSAPGIPAGQPTSSSGNGAATLLNSEFSIKASIPSGYALKGYSDGKAVWTSPKGDMQITASGMRNADGSSLETYRNKLSKTCSNIDYSPVGDDWFVLSGENAGKTYYVKCYVGSDYIKTIAFDYASGASGDKVVEQVYPTIDVGKL